MTNVIIRFTVQDEIYDQYEGILQEFINYLSELRVNDIDITEKEYEG
jgi:hypothetical protein